MLKSYFQSKNLDQVRLVDEIRLLLRVVITSEFDLEYLAYMFCREMC